MHVCTHARTHARMHAHMHHTVYSMCGNYNVFGQWVWSDVGGVLEELCEHFSN